MKKNFVFIMLVVSLVFGTVGNTALWGQAEPKTAEEFNNRARMFMIAGDYDRAIADCTQAIRLNPNSIDAYKRRGNAYIANEDYNRAIADFTQAIKLSPNDADAYTGRGSAYLCNEERYCAVCYNPGGINHNPGKCSVCRGNRYINL